ncbi:hypothetical protein [Kitasatospora sp. NPDC088548]|uniref:hypothetical protein n=1 Tax=Kitasatospora sp. NPDC088548 TaxID=3364075 RepID=UPI0037FC0845
MTTPLPTHPAPQQQQLPLRELLGLLLVVVGTVGLTVVAFCFHPLCGAAVVSALTAVTGMWLASEDENA